MIFLRRSRRSRWLPIGIVAAVAATTLVIPPGPAYADGWNPPEPQQDTLVEGEPVEAQPTPEDPAETGALTGPPDVTWPATGSAEATLQSSMTALTGLPVSVGPAPGAAGSAAPGRVRVELLAADASDVRLQVTRADGTATAAPVRLSFDYSDFRHAYGGDWAARLRLVELPGCALTQTAGVGDCPAPRPVTTANDMEHGTLTADVTAAPAAAIGADASYTAGLFAVAAAPSGATGSFAASTLSPTAKWQVSAQTGDFSWSYPLRVPPSLGGPSPQLAFTYSSGSVDGQTVSTNNQPSWVGQGFDFTPGGFIERRYKSCNDDGVTPKNGDQCWGGDNATMMLGGSATELVRDTGGVWRPKSDDGSRVEKLDGAINGDDDGEYWKITSTDGTQYFFGQNRLPGWGTGKQETRSAWTMPVFGDDAGEPCNAATYAASWCRQAYRWNLDHVIDTHGNTLSYFYQPETNHYGRNVKAADETSYTAGGYLEHIEYGQRSGAVHTTRAPARVWFTVDERCLKTASFDCAPDKLTPANAKYWPDVPADQLCAAGKDCPNFSPTFFTRKRLTKVTTEVLKAGAYVNVDSWTLTHTFPAAGDRMSPALWLDKIQQTGLVGGSESTPPVDLDGVEKPNRVDALEGIAPMMKWRVNAVENGTGGRLMVNYAEPSCARSALPSPSGNGKLCFPSYWAPEGSANPLLDWFHKYVVRQVLEADLMGGSSIVQTNYAYRGNPAWAYDDQELVPASRRTWSQYRGFEKVQVTKGDTRDVRVAVEHLFFRGMDGDKQPSGVRDVRVTDSEGVAVEDHWRLQGFERETRYLVAPDGAEQSGTINDPWLDGPTASGGGDQAYRLDLAKARSRAKLSTGVIRRTETQRSYDASAAVTQINDLGDTGTAADDRCTRFTYAPNTTAMILYLPIRIETVAVACTATPARPADVIGDGRMSYDGGAYGAAPTKGDITRTEELDAYNGGTPHYLTVSRSVYDDHGRVTESYDAADAKTTTAYSPASGEPVTQMTTTNPLQHTNKIFLAPEWGAMVKQEDANAAVTHLAYDPLGRLTKVWMPGRATTATPDGEYTYTVQAGKPVAITTKTLRNDGTTTVGHELYDGLLRLRQTQLPGHDGGRLVSDTLYNTLGQVAKKNDVYANADPPSTTILGAADSAMPAQTVFGYDGFGNITTETFKVLGSTKWQTTRAYAPDRVDVDPPNGATPTTSILDGRGRTVELWEYKGGAPTGDHDVTRYAYAKNGAEATVTDSAGNVWRTTYDVRNRVATTEDPDKGTTSYTYDVLDRPATSTDGRGRTLAYSHDALGRRTAMFEGSATGTKLAEWTYDALPDGTSVKGLPVAATRYSGGAAYVTRVDAYDEQYRPTSASYVIPDAEGALRGTYTFEPRYNQDGTPSALIYPAAGNLPAETVRTTYTALGLPKQTRSSLGMYVNDTLYSKTGELLQERWGETGARVLHDYTYEEGTRRVLRRITDRETASQARQADLNYRYDEAGNIIRVADTPPVANAPSDVQCFRYDYLRRLTQAWSATDNCAADPAASVVGGAAPYWHSYTYDKTGGRLTETRHAVAGATADTRSDYTYPAGPGAVRPHALQQVTTTGPAGTRLDTYAYDGAGNTTTRKRGSAEQTLTWDAEGNLSKVTEAGQTTSFLYDADGARLIRRDPTGTTLYLGAMEVRLATGATTPTAVRYYGHGDQMVAVRTDDRKLSWLDPDHNGTAMLSIDAASLQVTRRRFDPFGNPRGAVPASWPSERGFVGGTADQSTGLTHLGAREYDASTGRFLSVDPIMDPTDPQQLHGYAYAGNSPVTYADPAGTRELCGNYPGECQDAPPDGSSPKPPAGSNPGGGAPPTPPKGGPSQGDQDEARNTVKKTWQQVAIEVGGKLILDIIGFTDIRNCLQGNIGSCAMAIAQILPWGKLLKAGPLIKSAVRAGKAVLHWLERVKWARRILREADEAAAAAAKYEDDLAKWKKAQDAANAKKAAGAGPAGGSPKPGAGGGGGLKLPTVRERGPSCTNSFVPGTGVLMADGSHKPIQEVRLGDEVLATDPETGESTARPVVATIVGEGDRHLVEITVDTDGARGAGTGLVVATGNHPFWVDDRGLWIEAADLEIGDTLRTPAGARLAVVGLHERDTRTRVHNLTIDGVHTYHVAAGEADLLVHNCPSGGGGGGTGKSGGGSGGSGGSGSSGSGGTSSGGGGGSSPGWGPDYTAGTRHDPPDFELLGKELKDKKPTTLLVPAPKTFTKREKVKWYARQGLMIITEIAKRIVDGV
ncbi:hypothetical protein Aph01nite_10970 [Acrocarpospora phusangensis]|uniref:Hint domain-containing protein n=1 Tax=Acrocarpospora phusangensis TaxID=1070424 RepID=A0A919UM05_9ACTN|nr:polymorphic toxin-type HINT domain-containing protein [Acrocarpospora phusangensis]GIH22787.1 hypothetical protein Aph01nite_10970 [Acrocarpospora phusangensis]